MIPQEIIDNMEAAEKLFDAAHREVLSFKSREVIAGKLDKMDKYRRSRAKAAERYYLDEMKGHYHIIRELHLLTIEDITPPQP